MADESLQRELGTITHSDLFVGRALAIAEGLDLPLAQDALAAAIRPDPIGLARWRDPPHGGRVLPGHDWLPVHVAAMPNGVFVDWAWFGDDDLGVPFFEGAIRHALDRPFNRMFRYRMRIEDVVRQMPAEPEPSGFIFHMSRCGSTLVHRMLGAVPGTIAISEPEPLDAGVTLCRSSNLPLEAQRPYLRAMVAALGRRCAGDGARYVVKLDSWHTLALPLFRAAYPQVPWIFLYRDPAAVLASQLRQRGLQTVPEPRTAALYGIAGYEAMPSEEFCARALAAVCGAVLEHVGAPQAMLVDYAELPDAVANRILPHFGIAAGEAGGPRLAERARYDAKTPCMPFEPSVEGPDAALRALAERHLGDIHRALKRARGPH